ncbi:hypothetical protein CC1G_07676 [Coprinopsis cinerea okayama7|uniref:Uncharacterized protein n=1 Tax=Coprinopsis cinerea (strain Okayama-7 / 130 / ATCC MYA-4618 / FGSC 9003) TaxID=240176 RepID=A8NC72_COPC7|nr:hypothetical protein CC1G_07676 [Coprinopsis cinerea okayama7\|eukprot:XP_001832416.2 hypothetical protein CC1G_07676 [Coprinopsis cinerea okayama7\
MAEEDSHTAVKAVDNSEHSSISSEHPSKGDDEAIVEAGDNPDSVESDSVEETLASKEQKPYPPSSQQQHQQAAHGDEDSKEENLEEGEPDYGDLEEFPADPGL